MEGGEEEEEEEDEYVLISFKLFEFPSEFPYIIIYHQRHHILTLFCRSDSNSDTNHKSDESDSETLEKVEKRERESESESESELEFPRAGKRKGGKMPESKTKKKRKAFYDDL